MRRDILGSLIIGAGPAAWLQGSMWHATGAASSPWMSVIAALLCSDLA